MGLGQQNMPLLVVRTLPEVFHLASQQRIVCGPPCLLTSIACFPLTRQLWQLWEDELTIGMGAAGSTLLRIVVDGKDDFHSPTVLGVEEPR